MVGKKSLSTDRQKLATYTCSKSLTRYLCHPHNCHPSVAVVAYRHAATGNSNTTLPVPLVNMGRRVVTPSRRPFHITHSLVHKRGILDCLRCGAYARARPVKLGSPCKHYKIHKSKRVLIRLARHLHLKKVRPLPEKTALREGVNGISPQLQKCLQRRCGQEDPRELPSPTSQRTPVRQAVVRMGFLLLKADRPLNSFMKTWGWLLIASSLRPRRPLQRNRSADEPFRPTRKYGGKACEKRQREGREIWTQECFYFFHVFHFHTFHGPKCLSLGREHFPCKFPCTFPCKFPCTFPCKFPSAFPCTFP